MMSPKPDLSFSKLWSGNFPTALEKPSWPETYGTVSVMKGCPPQSGSVKDWVKLNFATVALVAACVTTMPPMAR
jgi:hypothetical protein